MQPTDMKGNKGGYEFSQGLHFAFDKIQSRQYWNKYFISSFTNFLKNSEYTQKGAGSNFLSKIPD